METERNSFCERALVSPSIPSLVAVAESVSIALPEMTKGAVHASRRGQWHQYEL